MSYDQRMKDLRSAFLTDAFNNPNGTELVKVSEQDVSDCPELDTSKDLLIFDVTEDCMDDLAHEMAMKELVQYA